MNNYNIYEAFHSSAKLQRKIISKNNFTYRNTIYLINKYFTNAKKILDIGCGVGTIDFYIASRKKHVMGIDISMNAINIARSNSMLLHLANKSRFLKMNFPKHGIKEKYDAILITEVIEHLKNDNNAVKKLHDISRKNTIIIASSPSKNAPLYRLGLLNDFDRKVGHLRRYSESEFISLFNSNDFKIIKIVKTEGIIRNFLFTNSFAGKLIRFIRGPLSDIVTFIDNLTIPIFGESNYYIVAKKK